MWHKTDWNKVREDPSSIGFPRDDWIHFHDAEGHAEQVFDALFSKHMGTDTKTNGDRLPYVEYAETVQPAITT